MIRATVAAALNNEAMRIVGQERHPGSVEFLLIAKEPLARNPRCIEDRLELNADGVCCNVRWYAEIARAICAVDDRTEKTKMSEKNRAGK